MTPRMLFWDIEVAHNLAAVFQLKHNDYIPHDNVVQERFMVSAAWKTPGGRTKSVSLLDDARRFKKDHTDDYHVVKTLHDVLSQTDILVAHNGDKFDFKWLNGRVIKHGMSKLPPIKSIDTLKVAKAHFNLNSMRLDYLGHYLGVGRKVHTDPGLWLKVLAGDAAAIRAMVRYNRGDVELLERVFEKLRPYVTEALNLHLYEAGDGCPRCGSARVQSRGVYRAITRSYPRYYCAECGGWWRGQTIRQKSETRLVA